jgi:transcriptional regulator with XRE-family HTH domain
MPTIKHDTSVEEAVRRIREKMRQWGITVSFLAGHLGVSRQYAWQIVNFRTSLSPDRANEIERAVDGIVAGKTHIRTFGERLRAARISAGFTLKQVAGLIGYSWVGVERWEKDQCLPKPGVLWHLFSLYGINEGRDTKTGFPYPHLQPELASGYVSVSTGLPGGTGPAGTGALKKAG